MNSQELRALQEAYNQVYELDEAEGSYGQTPKAQQKMGDLANKRRNTPASEYSERGEKKKKVDAASRHFNRMGNPDAGDRSKKSTKPDWGSGKRKGMTQSDRDHSRGEAEYGHTGYDPDWNGPASGPGGKPKGKKLERQKKTGVSAESFDLYDVILSHLLDEGYADTEQAAQVIMVNMSEDWREEIVEDAGIVSGLVGLALGAKGALHAAKKTKRLRDYPKNFVKGIADPRTYIPNKKKDKGDKN
jgi:hypothetical protein